MSAQFIPSPAPGQGAGPIALCATVPSPTRPAPGSPRAYAALPHALAEDPRLSPTDVRAAAALLFWARSKDHAWPSDRSIGLRIGRSVGTVQRSLRSLEAAGWIRRERSAANRTGRLIRLAWRAGARPPAPPALDPPPAPARDEGESGERDAANGQAAALLDRLRTAGLPEDLARRYARGERAAAAARVLANVEVLRAQGRLTNPAGYIRAGIEGGYALLPAAARRLEAERRAAEQAGANARAALERARAEAERVAEARAAAAALAAIEPARLEALVRRALEELPPPLTRSNATITNPFVRAKVLELERARSPAG